MFPGSTIIGGAIGNERTSNDNQLMGTYLLPIGRLIGNDIQLPCPDG